MGEGLAVSCILLSTLWVFIVRLVSILAMCAEVVQECVAEPAEKGEHILSWQVRKQFMSLGILAILSVRSAPLAVLLAASSVRCKTFRSWLRLVFLFRLARGWCAGLGKT